MKKIGIIGAGNMGGAIAQALCEQQTWSVTLFDTDKSKLDALGKKLGCSVASSLDELLLSEELLLLSVKPQVLPSLYATLRQRGASEKQWISIAAGVSLETLAKQLGTNEIVRFMPNLAAQVKQSVTAVAAHEKSSKHLLETALIIARGFGTAFPLPEEQIAAFTGISGSAIAYVFQFFHALAMGGVSEGLPYPLALAIARDTCLSAASLQKGTDENPVKLATMVCSAGGTTIEGMKALAEGAFDATVMEAVHAAAERFRDLEEESKHQGL
ncbi:pyrroline-5-carboxylate reductase [Sphaerochaeta sp. PS]|uniref:pyrroline-5-carboxylate reductase n=1 Tax=Sphaerochaeta sp. PS TaxID=3076336 RepID=UPI0028A5637A|nr:pyrroline-5-carboxylate reductase [Sphaerochaeta sp. PS]MDT4763107.1 pyrroline-5-carboxylate reductase [Sphaerochaeta sp. PS]